jgi:hypothetical protein
VTVRAIKFDTVFSSIRTVAGWFNESYNILQLPKRKAAVFKRGFFLQKKPDKILKNKVL